MLIGPDGLTLCISTYREGDYVLIRDLRTKLEETSKLKLWYKGSYLVNMLLKL